MQVRTLDERVVIKRKQEEKKVGSLFIPQTATEDQFVDGEVFIVGPGKKVDDKVVPMQVKVGDRVIFNRSDVTITKVNDEDFYIVKESNILGILD